MRGQPLDHFEDGGVGDPVAEDLVVGTPPADQRTRRHRRRGAGEAVHKARLDRWRERAHRVKRDDSVLAHDLRVPVEEALESVQVVSIVTIGRQPREQLGLTERATFAQDMLVGGAVVGRMAILGHVSRGPEVDPRQGLDDAHGLDADGDDAGEEVEDVAGGADLARPGRILAIVATRD